MTNDDELPRAAAFVNRARVLELSDADLHIVLDDALDIDPHDMSGDARMIELLTFAQTLFTSDDDYDDFTREVRGILAGDDACPDCGYDVEGDCFCDDEDPLDPNSPDYDLFNE